jgi:hypothetical protein
VPYPESRSRTLLGFKKGGTRDRYRTPQFSAAAKCFTSFFLDRGLTTCALCVPVSPAWAGMSSALAGASDELLPRSTMVGTFHTRSQSRNKEIATSKVLRVGNRSAIEGYAEAM